VRIAVIECASNPTKLVETLSGIPSLRAISCGTDNRELLFELFGMSSLMSNLTHLHIFRILSFHFDEFRRDPPLNFPNLRYLALHFGKSYLYQDEFDGIPNWKFKQLGCLSITIEESISTVEHKPLPLHALCEQLSSSGTNLVSELLLEFYDHQIESPFSEQLWEVWFPHLTVLSFPAESIAAVTSSLLAISTNKFLKRPISLFLLDGDRSKSAGWVDPDRHSLDELYRAGYLERICIPKSRSLTNFVISIVKYCIEHKIPVYDAAGWQIHETSLP
jgi:hypothetical protein